MATRLSSPSLSLLSTSLFGTEEKELPRLQVNPNPCLHYIHQSVRNWVRAQLSGSPDFNEEDCTKAVLESLASFLIQIKTFGDEPVYIDELAGALPSPNFAQAGPDQRDLPRQLIFALLGWTSMLYTPASKPTDRFFCIKIPVALTSFTTVEQSVDLARRPIKILFRALDVWLPFNLSSGEDSDTAPSLEASQLQYSALGHVSNISLRWVDSLESHLRFDATLKQLMIFRYPSFAAISYFSPNATSFDR
jgi:hypothetical protein